MKLQNNRPRSFATNSSSSHMVITAPADHGPVPDPRTLENEFGWHGPDVDTFWGKVMYALVQHAAAGWATDVYDVRTAFPELKGVEKEWMDAAAAGYIDHQSVTGDIYFWEMVARNDRAVIKIRNDNEWAGND